MKIITFSDLHLELGYDFELPKNSGADLLILAGDMMTFDDYTPFSRILEGWKKPVIYVAGNHEYYTQRNMHEDAAKFQAWVCDAHPNVHFLQDSGLQIEDVHFFGGTMWTDFQGGSQKAMFNASVVMSDFRLIKTGGGVSLTPQYTIHLHDQFVAKLRVWFDHKPAEKRIVVTHHAPVINPETRHIGSPITAAFNSTDMLAIIDKYQPDFWIYGHTHECDDQFRKKTRIISNQRGYRHTQYGYECENGFDVDGKPIDI